MVSTALRFMIARYVWRVSALWVMEKDGLVAVGVEAAALAWGEG